ncbi:hypothetical protein K6119_15435 [Paracrocinitomix mangrovi]|uniref:hypothetical protein n=1 Tax=Paracrocinitomix mangrovi TaxID=2862509 RepID=UPI001C8D81F9|nr:hypothetical protein [Paracrocinitomix mangrovi]UKN01121.1 hypothetical protein K6119_15435 [Paracrocinitomix mangrovi]
MKRVLLIMGVALILPLSSNAQINLNKIKNKAKGTVKTNNNSSSSSSSSSGDSKTTNNTNSGTSTSTSQNTASGENAYVVESMPYYYEKGKHMHNIKINLTSREWDRPFLDELEQLDFPAIEAKIKADEEKLGDYLMIYPKKLPTSGMGTMTQQNMNEYSFARFADANAEPPSGDNGKKILDFYKDYVLFKKELIDGKGDLVKQIRDAIQEAEGAHPRNQYTYAKEARDRADMAVLMVPGEMQLEDMRDEAHQTYKRTIEQFGKMITGTYHRDHLEQIVVFGSEPKVGTETDAQLIETIIPGKPAYITGYFTMTNKTAGGIPSLLFISPDDKYAKDKNPWGHGTEIRQSMFNGTKVKEASSENAYFVFNLFPDINTVNYESHVQYFPHLNILKWMMYLPDGVHDIPVRYGNSTKLAYGRLKVDLTGDNKQNLKNYYNQLLEKQKSAVTFPDLAGCSDDHAKIRNYTDLSKYGKVLKVSLSQTGDIMKPWPNDHEVDFNTAAGYAAVEKDNGKVEVMPLEFRKKPGESTWQWWSVGKFPNLYPMNDNGTDIVGVKKLEYGYEILPENVNKCGYWYSAN